MRVFAIDPTKGTLTPIDQVSTQGKTPRNFSLDPTGAYLFAANENSSISCCFMWTQTPAGSGPLGSR